MCCCRSGVRWGRLWNNIYPLLIRQIHQGLWYRRQWRQYIDQYYRVTTPVCNLLQNFQPQVHCIILNKIGASDPSLFIIRWVKSNQYIWKLKSWWFYDTKPSKHLTGFEFLLYYFEHAPNNNIITHPQFFTFGACLHLIYHTPPSNPYSNFLARIALFLAIFF